VRALAKEIEALAKPGLDMGEMADLEAETLRQFAAQKAKQGSGVIAMAELEGEDEDGSGSAEVIDLMEVLRKSLGANAAGAATPKPATTTSAPPAKTAAKAAPERAAKKTAAQAAAKTTPAKKVAAKKQPHGARRA
jgi:non-homologous end joining protein Ku